MNVLARGKCAPDGFLIIWLMNMKDTHGVIPDSSSTLRTAWWSILTQNCYRRWDLGLWLHSREQGCITDLEASLSSQKEVQDSAVSRKMKATAFWDVYGVIILVDFIPPSSTANASAYQETLNRLKEAIQKRDQDCWPQKFFCTTMLNLTLLPQLWIPWTPGAGEFFHINHTVLICHHWTSTCSQRWKSTSEVSDSTPGKTLILWRTW